MKTQTITLEANLTSQELVSKLKTITAEDYDKAHLSPNIIYYGEVASHSFKIKNVRYSPYSQAPDIKGEITESVNNRTIIKLDMDIRESYRLARNMYFSTLLPIGMIVMLLSLLVLGGTEFQWQGLLFSSSFVAVAILAVLLQRITLVSMKKTELKDFISRIDGRIISPKASQAWHKHLLAPLSLSGHISE